jgi:hypothetical protein
MHAQLTVLLTHTLADGILPLRLARLWCEHLFGKASARVEQRLLIFGRRKRNHLFLSSIQ